MFVFVPFLRFLLLLTGGTAVGPFAYGFPTIHNYVTRRRNHHPPHVGSLRWPRMATSMSMSMAASSTSSLLSDVIVGGVLSLTGQEVSRRLGRSSSFGQVSALVYDDRVFSRVVDDDKRPLSEDSVLPLLLVGEEEEDDDRTPPPKVIPWEAAVIATDTPPSPEAIECFVEDAATCGALTIVMLSRMPPSGDVAAWRLAEDAAIRSIRQTSSASSLQSLTILRTAELVGGPYYALNPDLLLVSNAKYITTSHRDFSIGAAATTSTTTSTPRKKTPQSTTTTTVVVRQQDVGMSRPMAAQVLETVLSFQLGVAHNINVRQPNHNEEDDEDDDSSSSSSASCTPRKNVSILNLASVQSNDAPTEADWKERIEYAIQQSVVPLVADSSQPTTTTALPTELQPPQSSTLPPPPFSRAPTLASLAMPPPQVFNNPFLAPPAVSGPYWFFVFLLVVGFGLASQGLTWCSVHWAVDPDSRFYLPVTEKTCACQDDLYKICTPVGDNAEGSFRFLQKWFL